MREDKALTLQFYRNDSTTILPKQPHRSQNNQTDLTEPFLILLFVIAKPRLRRGVSFHLCSVEKFNCRVNSIVYGVMYWLRFSLDYPKKQLKK